MKILRLFFLLVITTFYYCDSDAKNQNLIIDQNEINRFIEVFKIIKKNYIYEINDKKAINDSLKGLLSGLDPHSLYYKQDDYSDLLDKNKGVYGGIGIEVSLVDKNLHIVKISNDSSAEKNGLMIGDIVIEIDGKKIDGMTISSVKNLIKGEIGSEVNIKVLRDLAGEDNKILNFKLERGIVKIENLESQEFSNDILYLKINRFYDSLFDDISEKIKNNENINGIILDLRNNGGGLLDQAVKIADGFLKSGEIVSTKSRNPEDGMKRYNASGINIVNDKVKIVVLINNYSASASEIVAAALKDNKRAILVGKTTFGKGSVQNVIPLKDGDAIKLTTALFYRPNGNLIQELGVEPDIEIDDLIIGGIKSDGEGAKNEIELQEESGEPILNSENEMINSNVGIKNDDLQLYVAKQIINYQLSKV